MAQEMKVARNCTFGPGWFHSEPPEFFNTMPDTLVLKKGDTITVEDGSISVKITCGETAKTVSRGMFFSAIGDRCLEFS